MDVFVLVINSSFSYWILETRFGIYVLEAFYTYMYLEYQRPQRY